MGQVPGRPYILRDPRDPLTTVDYISTISILTRARWSEHVAKYKAKNINTNFIRNL